MEARERRISNSLWDTYNTSSLTKQVGGWFGPWKTSLTPPQVICACPKSGYCFGLWCVFVSFLPLFYLIYCRWYIDMDWATHILGLFGAPGRVPPQCTALVEDLVLTSKYLNWFVFRVIVPLHLIPAVFYYKTTITMAQPLVWNFWICSRLYHSKWQMMGAIPSDQVTF